MTRMRSSGVPPKPAKRKRGLSDDDMAVWDSVTESIKPLRKKPPRVAGLDTLPAQPAPAVAIPQPPAVVPVRKADKRAALPLAPIGRREKSQLGRGRKEIDARLDLHGMTQARAHRALLSFLRRAQQDGATYVLVITGKGRSGASDTERGVLRRQVPEWLGLAEFRALVVGFESAHISHGGDGALYVRVRKER